MIGTHAILQVQCPICFGSFLFGNVLDMRVVDQGQNGVMVKYLHDYCAPK